MKSVNQLLSLWKSKSDNSYSDSSKQSKVDVTFINMTVQLIREKCSDFDRLRKKKVILANWEYILVNNTPKAPTIKIIFKILLFYVEVCVCVNLYIYAWRGKADTHCLLHRLFNSFISLLSLPLLSMELLRCTPLLS